MIRSTLAAVIAAVLWSSCVSESSAIRSAMYDLVHDRTLAGGRVGVVVADAATGGVLAQHSSDSGFATASNMKLLASAVALHTLGPDYRAKTEVVVRGSVSDGVLSGDLVLRGYGDPTLGQPSVGAEGLDTLVAAVLAAGIRRIEGRVTGDGSWLGPEQRGHGWQWDYLSDGYAAPFGGLCMAGNTVLVRVAPGQHEPSLTFMPMVSPSPVVTIVQGAAGSKTDIVAHRELGSDVITLRGTMAADADPVTLKVAVNDSERFAATVLAQRLRDTGVEIGGREMPAHGVPEHVLAACHSPELGRIVGPLLTNSNNLYAEQVWRIAARHATGLGDTATAARHTADFFRSIGIDPTGMVLADGSGLSRRNLVQPHQIAELLLWVRRTEFADMFIAGLPVAGRTGTLLARFRDGLATGRVRAKTGYISRVVCLSGYLERPDPDVEPLVFCVMLNDFTCSTQVAKKALDSFVERLAAIAGW